MPTFKLLYITITEVLAILFDADQLIKGVQIGNHETKQYIWLITPPFLLRYVTCLTRIQAFLKL